MCHIRRRLDSLELDDIPAAIIIEATVAILFLVLIVIGLYYCCKERERKKVMLDPFINLATHPPVIHLSPRFSTPVTQNLGNDAYKLQPLVVVDMPDNYYVMRSPGNPSGPEAAKIQQTESQASKSNKKPVVQVATGKQEGDGGQSYSNTQQQQKPVVQMAPGKQEDNGEQSCSNTQQQQQLKSVETTPRKRSRSLERYKSFNQAMGYTNSTLDSGRSVNDNASTWPSTNDEGLWEDAVILAARIPMDNIEIGDTISRGGYGEVFRGVYRDQDVAIKRLLPETRADVTKVAAFLAEVKLQATLKHERVVRFLGVAWDSAVDLCVVSEFMECGDLRALMVQFDEVEHRPVGFNATKARIALDVAHGLTYLHSLNPSVLHRDLKSRNILLDRQWRAKLTDFGVSRERSEQTMTAGVGTSLWMAPEVMMGERYDEKADLFSFGVVLSELDSHKAPYAKAKVTKSGRVIPSTAILQLVSSGNLSVKFTPQTSPGLKAMVRLGKACVSLKPDERPTAAQALYQMQLVMRTFTHEDVEKPRIY